MRRTNERGMEIWEFGINGDQTTERQKRKSNSGEQWIEGVEMESSRGKGLGWDLRDQHNCGD
jgi:hypothetical protein